MAKTITESFNQFATNLNITDRQITGVSNCRTNIVKKLGEKLTLNAEQGSKLIGSYDRDTLTRYLKEGDIDLMVVLNYGAHKDWDNKEGVHKALKKFKEILDEAYPNTAHRVDRNCVTMQLSNFRFDVVPAFMIKEGGYEIPDTYRNGGEWIATKPVEFAAEVTRINKNMSNNFIPLIKMIKGWNREQSKPLRSFHLECLLVKHYKNCTSDYNYPSMVKVFLGKLPEYLGNASYDPITGDRVDYYLGNKKEEFVNRAKKAADQAELAFTTQDTDVEFSIDQWKDLLGEFFPTYG